MNPARAFGPAAVSGYLMENASTHAVSTRIFATPRRTCTIYYYTAWNYIGSGVATYGALVPMT